MQNKLAQLSPQAQQEFYAAAGSALQSQEMAESGSFLNRIMHRIYQLKAQSSYDVSAEEAGYRAVEGFLGRVQKCVDKDIAPSKLINIFLPYEKKIMLEELEHDEKLSKRTIEQYVGVKNALPRRKFLGIAIAGAATVTATVIGCSDAKKEQQEVNAQLKELNTAKDAEQNAIKKLIQNPDKPDTQVINDIANSRKKIQATQATLARKVEKYEQVAGYAGAAKMVGGAVIGTLLAGLFVVSAFNIGRNRAGLEDYKGNTNFFGIGAPLNEQLVDQGLKIEINKFRTNVDDFLMGIASTTKNQNQDPGIS